MALFGAERDISLFRHVNRELMGDIISQQAAFYKFQLQETKINIYGEASGAKYYMGPVLLNCLIERQPQTFSDNDFGIANFDWDIEFRFLRDDLLNKAKDFNEDWQFSNTYGANLVPEVGDVILYQESYYEVHNTNANQYFVGKNPDYPNQANPLETDLDKFGYNVSIICQTHYVPQDKLGLTLARL